MIAFFLLLILLGVAFVMREMSMRTWLAVTALAMLLGGVTGLTNGPLSLLTALVMGAVLMLFYFTPDLRRRWLTRPLFDRLGPFVPGISPAEEEIIDAGTAGWEKELFAGRPDWDGLMDTPGPRLDQAEREFIEGPVEELCAMSDDREICHRLNDLPPEVWLCIRDRGFLGLSTPREYGGLGFSPHAQSCIVQKLATRSSAVAATVLMRNSLGPAMLHRFGTMGQKNQYLPQLARGEEISGFCLSGMDPGTAGMPGSGVVCSGTFNGTETLGFLVSWACSHIALGPAATLLGLAFRSYDPDGLLGDARDLGITCVLIPADADGVTMGRRRRVPGSAFQSRPVSGKDVFVPMEWVIGGPERVGQGRRMLMQAFTSTGDVFLPAVAGGAARFAARAAGAQALVREEFGRGADRFRDSGEVLASIGGLTYLLDSGRIMMAASPGGGERSAALSAIVSQQCAELSREVVNHAMDLHGRRAACMETGNPLVLAGQLVSIVAAMEDAGALNSGMTPFAQAAMRGHPCLLEEVRAVHDPDREAGLAAFDAAFCGHLTGSIENKIRTFVCGLSCGLLARGTGDARLLRYSRQVDYLGSAFAWVADMTLAVLGGDLKRREILSGRFADVLGNLYLATATIKRYREGGEDENEAPLMEWACQTALNRAQQALDGILGNFPLRYLGPALRIAVFPTGRYLRQPDERLNREVARILRTPGPVRDRLTEDVYLPDDPGEVMARLEAAMELCSESAELRHRLGKSGIEPGAGSPWNQWLDGLVAAGDVTDGEADLLRRTLAAVSKLIAVDDYPGYAVSRQSGSGNGDQGEKGNKGKKGEKGRKEKKDKKSKAGNREDGGDHES